MDYPATRTVTWIDDEGNQVGQCKYVRVDIVDDLFGAIDEIADADGCMPYALANAARAKYQESMGEDQ